MKLLYQATLIEFHKWLRETYPNFGKLLSPFWCRWYNGKRKIRVDIYNIYLNQLKQKQHNELEKAFWLEIHGEL